MQALFTGNVFKLFGLDDLAVETGFLGAATIGNRHQRRIIHDRHVELGFVLGISGIDEKMAEGLVHFANMTRNLRGSGLEEGASTRLLVHTGKLIISGIDPVVACRCAIAEALTDDAEMLAAVNELGRSVF